MKTLISVLAGMMIFLASCSASIVTTSRTVPNPDASRQDQPAWVGTGIQLNF